MAEASYSIFDSRTPDDIHREIQEVYLENARVNLIGRGYPAPYTRFRWCTDRMKIRPANKFVLDKVAEYGEVIMVLGVRKGESATRDQVLSLHSIQNSLLLQHSTLPNAFVYAPIVDFSLNDVWFYLLNIPSPWNNDNKELITLYRNSNAQGECPLVVDETTPSCGNSRFGCWTCTVVTKDKAMEGLIDSGEDWMIPLLEFRDFLAKTQDPERKPEIREHRRRNGQITILNDKLVHGPYTLEFCKELLERLLTTQQQVRKDGPDPDTKLITDDELEEIRKIWRIERQDWEDAVPQIYAEIVGDRDWIVDDTFSFSEKDKEILEAICDEKGVPITLVSKLLDTEQQMDGMSRRAKIQSRIDEIFHEDWRSEKEAYNDVNELMNNDSS